MVMQSRKGTSMFLDKNAVILLRKYEETMEVSDLTGGVY
ncbi:hypothetical protein PFLA_b0093 [Pseudoalteromonas flavipulchra NCIMB 2033 = ATCC BAA-314]|nr:hypothetical protein [Pseudoalteromonas flavipulchra NCIMB 2033 = ATCC BAA-314]